MSRFEALAVLSDVAAGQWGLVTAGQAKKLGVSPNHIARLAALSVVRRVRHGVYALAGAPASELEQLRGEWLATDAEHTVAERAWSEYPVIVTQESAAGIYGFGDFTTDHIHFNSARRLQTSQPAVQISHRAMPGSDWQLVDGLPVTTPKRTLEDLASLGRWDAHHLETAILDALASGRLHQLDVEVSKVLGELPFIRARSSDRLTSV